MKWGTQIYGKNKVLAVFNCITLSLELWYCVPPEVQFLQQTRLKLKPIQDAAKGRRREEVDS